MESILSNLLGQFGMIPVLLLLVAIVWFLLREIKKEVSGLTASIKTMKEDIAKKLDAYQARSDEMDEKLEGLISGVTERVACVEREYVTKEDMYKDLGGWREESRETNQRIDAMSVNLASSIQNIMGMMAHGR